MAAALTYSKLLSLLLILATGLRLSDEDTTRELVHRSTPAWSSSKSVMRAQNEATEPIPAATAAPQDMCGVQVRGAVTRNSAWMRYSHKCKCPVDKMVVCPQPDQDGDCEAIGRKFNGKLYDNKGCECNLCDTTCAGVVPGSQNRNSAWRRTTIKCKCHVDEEIRGQDAVCVQMKTEGTRKFSRAQVRNKGCSCVNKTIEETPAPLPTTTTTPATLPKGGAATQGGHVIAVFALPLLLGVAWGADRV